MVAYPEASFGEALKSLRNRKHLSRPMLAQRLGIHPRTLENWERGDVLPDRARVDELIDALSLSRAEEQQLLEIYTGHRILPSLHHLPAGRNPYFIGREAILVQIHSALMPGSQIALAQAISGLGGVGKTQVALEYAYRYRKAYSQVLWVTAYSPETLTQELSELAQDLDLPEKDEKDQGKIVRVVQRWLRDHPDWLLVLDNVEDLSLVSSFVPAGHSGSVLLTTRQQVTEPVAQAIVLDMLSDDEGILFLLKRTKRLAFDAVLTATSTSEMVIARTITQQLGGLPLALDQAGAYIAENRCSLSHYLNLLKQQQRVLLQRRGTIPSDHRQSVTTTFSLAFEQLQQKNKAASDLLTVCAFLAPDAIPLEIITEGAAHLGMVLGTVAGDTLQLDKMLETLQACSLVQRDPDEKNLAIHRLVQAVLQDTLEETERYSWAERTMLAINAAFPEVEHKTWSQCKRLLPHALLAAQYIERQQITNKEAGRLLFETAVYLRDRSRYSEAERLFLQALQTFEQLSGPEHLDVVTPLNGLAALYTYQGKYEQAELHYKRALQIYEQQLQYSAGDAPLNGLASLYVSLGKYELAEPLFLQALEIRKQQLGVEHLDVAVSLNNLASLYHYQGKYEQAEPLYLQALEICERQPDHPNLAYLLSNLATLYLDQDNYVKAEPLFLRSRQICEQQLGLEHHGMAYPLNGLAEFYYKQGKYVEAEPLYQQSLQIWERQLGPEHPDVAASLHGLANLYRDQAKYVEAESLYRRALRIRELVLGSEQSETANVMHDFARFQEVRGNREEARAGYVRTLLIREQTLGVHHPKTRETRKYLIALLHTMGQHEEATRLEDVQQKP